MNQKQIAPYLTLLITAAITASFATDVAASHPYHVSKAEVNWNTDSGNFEVALCVWPSDLEKALAAQAGKPVDLAKVEQLDELLTSYIKRKFRVRKTAADGKPTDLAAIRWVGHEKNNKEAWLYFEVVGDKKQVDWTIENRVFFELNEDQLNQIQFTLGRTYQSHLSSAAKPIHSLRTRKPNQ